MAVHNKIVRNNIPMLLEQNGKHVKMHTLSDSEYSDAVLNKLSEKVDEYSSTNNIECLADMLELIETLLDHKNIPFEVIRELQLGKREARGGYDKKLFIEEIN